MNAGMSVPESVQTSLRGITFGPRESAESSMAFGEMPGRKAAVSIAAAFLIFGAGDSLLIHDAEVPAAQTQSAARPVGTIKTISENTITLRTDAGSDVNILVQDTTKFIRIAPGQKDLKDAA